MIPEYPGQLFRTHSSGEMLGHWIGQVFSLGLLLAASASATLGGVAESVHQLNEDNFEEKASKGLW